MDSVGADEDVRANGFAVLEPQHRLVAFELDRDAAPAEMERVLGDSRSQGGQQIGAVGGVGVLAVQAFALVLEVLRGEDGAVLPAPELPADLHLHRALDEPVQHAETPQQAGGVGGDHQAGPDLGEGCGLLVDVTVEALVAEEGRGSEASDAATEDRDPGACFRSHHAFHSRWPLARW